MELIDFSNCKIINKTYNGANGHKIAGYYNNELYMLKFPTESKLNNRMHYANSSISEYLGCYIFNMVGVEAQSTLLGKYKKNKKEYLIIACKDFIGETNFVFQDFASLKNQIVDSEKHGKGTELESILFTINEQTVIDKKLLLERFWETFIVDSFIGNWDRHNGNWGFLYNQKNDFTKLAPIFDCGSSLYPQADEEIQTSILNNKEDLLYRIYEIPTSALQIKNKRIRYFDFLENTTNQDCINALKKINEKINLNEINKVINEISFLSDLQKNFYSFILSKRKELILDVAYKKQASKFISYKMVKTDLLQSEKILNFSEKETRSSKMKEIIYTRNQDVIFHGPKNPLMLKGGQELPKGVTPDHVYVFPDGTICKSVTQILVNQGYADDFLQLTGKAKALADEAAEYGTLVHAVVSNYITPIKTSFSFSQKNAECIKRLEKEIEALIPDKANKVRTKLNSKGKEEEVLDENGKAITWKESVKIDCSLILNKIEDQHFIYIDSEKTLALQQPTAVAGTADLIGVKKNGEVTIMDFKTGNHDYAKENLQLNFYAKMLEVNTSDEKLTNGIIAKSLMTINTKTKETYSYNLMPTSFVRDILIAEKKNVRLPDVLTIATEGVEALFNAELSEACEKQNQIIMMKADFLATHPNFAEEYEIYKNIEEEGKTSKEEIKKLSLACGSNKLFRPDFNASISQSETKKVDYEKLIEKYPKAYQDCVSNVVTNKIYLKENEEYLEKQIEKKVQKEEAVAQILM